MRVFFTLIIVLLFFGSNANGQTIGASKNRVIQQQGQDYKSYSSGEGMSYITYFDKENLVSTSYYFDKQATCVLMTMCYPKSSINSLVRVFDKDYVKISEHIYKDYEYSTIIKILPQGDFVAVSVAKAIE